MPETLDRFQPDPGVGMLQAPCESLAGDRIPHPPQEGKHVPVHEPPLVADEIDGESGDAGSQGNEEIEGVPAASQIGLFAQGHQELPHHTVSQELDELMDHRHRIGGHGSEGLDQGADGLRRLQTPEAALRRLPDAGSLPRVLRQGLQAPDDPHRVRDLSLGQQLLDHPLHPVRDPFQLLFGEDRSLEAVQEGLGQEQELATLVQGFQPGLQLLRGRPPGRKTPELQGESVRPALGRRNPIDVLLPEQGPEALGQDLGIDGVLLGEDRGGPEDEIVQESRDPGRELQALLPQPPERCDHPGSRHGSGESLHDLRRGLLSHHGALEGRVEDPVPKSLRDGPQELRHVSSRRRAGRAVSGPSNPRLRRASQEPRKEREDLRRRTPRLLGVGSGKGRGIDAVPFQHPVDQSPDLLQADRLRRRELGGELSEPAVVQDPLEDLLPETLRAVPGLPFVAGIGIQAVRGDDIRKVDRLDPDVAHTRFLEPIPEGRLVLPGPGPGKESEKRLQLPGLHSLLEPDDGDAALIQGVREATGHSGLDPLVGSDDGLPTDAQREGSRRGHQADEDGPHPVDDPRAGWVALLVHGELLPGEGELPHEGLETEGRFRGRHGRRF